MASITARVFLWGAAGLIGAGAGVAASRAWPRPDVEALTDLAARLESGRWADLVAVVESDLPVTPTLLGLRAEARSRMWSEFERQPEDRAEAVRALAVVPEPWRDAAWFAHAITSTAPAPGEPPDTPKGRVARALLSEGRGRPEAALIQMVGAARAQPQRRNTQLALARMHMRRGAWSAARDVLDALLDERPQDAMVWALDGRARVRLGERPRPPPLDQALGPPERTAVLATQALAAAADGRYDAASSAIDATEGEGPHRAALLLWAGRPRKAEAVYETLGDPFGVARSRFSRRLKSCGVELAPGRILIDGEARPLGHLEADLWPLARFVPNPNVFPEQLYRAAETPTLRTLGAANRVGLARMCLAAGEAGRATRLLERAARIEGELVRPELRARALLEAGRPRSALAVLVQIPEGERTPMQRLWFARALRARGRQADALDLIASVAADVSVRAPSVLRLAASLEWELEQPPQSLERLLRIVPEDVGARLMSALVEEKALELEPERVAAFMDEPGWFDLPPAARALGALELWPAQPKRAERALRRSIADGAQKGRRQLGTLLFGTEGREAEGRALLEEYLEQAEEGPSRDEVRALLGVE
jgi:hypothetical protein